MFDINVIKAMEDAVAAGLRPVDAISTTIRISIQPKDQGVIYESDPE